MKRVQYYCHGGPEVLMIGDTNMPTPGRGKFSCVCGRPPRTRWIGRSVTVSCR